MRNIKAFTLIELMVVILIVGILAAASVPLMRGRVDSAKWAEANAMAGTIRSAARVYYAETGTVATTANLEAMGITAGDLQGTYFNPGNFTIGGTPTEANGWNVAVTVVGVAGGGTSGKGPAGTKTLDVNGNWN